MNFFDRILHYYIYDMRLKKKLVVSHTILFLIPTAVLICFLFLNIKHIPDHIGRSQGIRSMGHMGNKVFNRKYGLGTEGLFGADGIIHNDPEDI